MSEENKELINEEKDSENVKEEVAEDINSLLPTGTPIEKPVEGQEPYDVVIENARLAFMKKFRASRRNSYIVMGVILGIAVASVICIGLKGMVFKILGWSLIGAALVGMLVYYIVTRNIMPLATKEYIALVNESLNVRNFSDEQFNEVTTDKNEKIEMSDPVSDRIYKDINNIASRNVINGKFQGKEFKVGDMGLYTGAGKSRRSLFVGKYLTYTNNLHFENRYIFLFKGSSAVDLPDDLDDLKVLLQEGNLTVYGPENGKLEKDLGKEFLSKIKEVAIERHLLNLNLVIWSGHSAAYLSYDDVIMTLPFEKKFNKEPNEQYAKNQLDLFNAFALLNKEEK